MASVYSTWVTSAAVLLVLPAVVASQSSRRLEFQLSPECEVGAKVVARHPACVNSSAPPWYPAVVTGSDSYLGSISLTYGHDVDRPWGTGAVQMLEVYHYSCLDAGWARGDAGRGFAYLPDENLPDGEACNATECAAGCKPSVENSCEQGAYILFGENCTTRCSDGLTPSVENVTCRHDVPSYELEFLCLPPVVYCEDLLANYTSENNSVSNQTLNATLNGSANFSELANASNATGEVLLRNLELIISDLKNATGCVQRATTTTTTVQPADRVLRGCSELLQLRPGELTTDPSLPPLPVGMPNAAIAAGAFYFEVDLAGPFEQVGWADGAWTGQGDVEHQWLSQAGGAGIVGVAAKVTGRGTAEVWFSRDGVWERGPNQPSYPRAVFTPPLMPVALLRGPAAWRVPYDSWRRHPPRALYDPLTGMAFPESCKFPLEYGLFAHPPNCTDDFEGLTTPEDCASAALHIGLTDVTVRAGEFVGWPAGCFRCERCDLSGDLYWNLASGAENTTQEPVLQAPDVGSLCRRFDPARTTTTTTVEPRVTTTTLVPPVYFRNSTGHCDDGYEVISNQTQCEDAARWLGLDDETATVMYASQPGAGQWPHGCFRCPQCGAGRLFLNEAVSGNETLYNYGAQDTQAICQALPETLTTRAGGPAVSSTTGGAGDGDGDGGGATSSTTEAVYYTTLGGSTTTTAPMFEIFSLTCDDPYVIEQVVEWWQRVEVIVGGAAFFFCCCCVPFVCWFLGIAAYIQKKINRVIARNKCLRNCICCVVARCVRRCCSKIRSCLACECCARSRYRCCRRCYRSCCCCCRRCCGRKGEQLPLEPDDDTFTVEVADDSLPASTWRESKDGPESASQARWRSYGRSSSHLKEDSIAGAKSAALPSMSSALSSATLGSGQGSEKTRGETTEDEVDEEDSEEESDMEKDSGTSSRS